MTLSKYDCNEYNSTVNLFLHYYPGSKQGKCLDAHYNYYVNTQYHKQNATAISSMMVETIEEEEEVEKALKKNKGKGKTAATLSTNVQSIMEPQKEEAEKTSQKQNKSDASSSETRNLRSSTQTTDEENRKFKLSQCLFGRLFKLMCKKVVKEFMSLLLNQQIDALCCICKDIYFNSSDRNRDVNRDDQ